MTVRQIVLRCYMQPYYVRLYGFMKGDDPFYNHHFLL